VATAGRHICFAAALVNKGAPTPDATGALPTGYDLVSSHQVDEGGVLTPEIYVAAKTADLVSAEDPEAIDWTSDSGGRFFVGVTVLIPAGAADPAIPLGVTVLDDGTEIGRYTRLDFISGTNISVVVAEDGSNPDEADITITGTGGGGGGSAPEWISYLAERQSGETADDDDDFFDDATKTGFTELTVAGTATWTEAYGRLAVKAIGGATGDAAAALKAITASGPPLTVETAVMPDLRGEDFFLYGVCFADGTTSAANVVSVGMLARASGVNNIQCNTGTLTNVLATNRVTFVNTTGNHRGLTYLRLVQTASNTWAANYSTNGITWHDMGLAPFAFTMTPTHFAPFAANYNSATVPLMASWEYLRMNEASLDV
jgi:hypothetical protein